MKVRSLLSSTRNKKNMIWTNELVNKKKYRILIIFFILVLKYFNLEYLCWVTKVLWLTLTIIFKVSESICELLRNNKWATKIIVKSLLSLEKITLEMGSILHRWWDLISFLYSYKVFCFIFIFLLTWKCGYYF